jgi:hydrophobic/amphiphilic exporter-1 (mainly G- bacteria), HAE1 family
VSRDEETPRGQRAPRRRRQAAAPQDEPRPAPEAPEATAETTEALEEPPGAPPPSSFSTRRPVAVAVLFLAAVVFGALSYLRLPVALMPELTYPTLTVRTHYPGAAPEEVENEVSRPIEEVLGVLGGLRRLSSISRAEVSDVVLELSWDTTMADAVQNTLERLDRVLLPEGAERPLVLRFDPSLDPVLELSLSGEGEEFQGEEGLRRLRRIAELQVKRALEPLSGVAAVQVRGGLEEEVHILLDQRELARTGLDVQQVIERLRQENVNLAGGTLREGTTEYMVRTLNELRNLGEIADLVVTRLPGGREVRIRDLGRVEHAHKERQILTRTAGADSVQLDVYREGDANLVALSRRLRAALGSWEAGRLEEEGQPAAPAARAGGGPGGNQALPLAARLFREEGVKLEVVADRSEFIASSIRELGRTVALGGLLAVVVLFLFLGSVRTTTIVAVSIPASLAIAFAPLNVLGVSLNIMSLGGLALGVGMLVDSSIVVLESIFRCREEGDGHTASVVRGTSEVRGAVVASTLTSIAVFFPMVFVEGVAGQAFGDLGLAVVVSLLAALAVALFLIPMLAARGGLRLPRGREGFRPALLRFPSFGVFLADLRGLRWTLLRALVNVLFIVYFTVRLLLGLALELVGKLVVGALLLVAALGVFLWRWALRPAGSWLARGPVAATQRALGSLQGHYGRMLESALARPGVVLAAVALSIGATLWIFSRLGTELLPEVTQGEVTFEVALPPGTPLDRTAEILAPVEAAVLAESRHLRSLLVTYGFDPVLTQRSDEGEHTARFKLVLERADPKVEAEVVSGLRRRLAAIPDLDQRVVRPVLFSFQAPVEVEVHGESLEALREWGERVAETMARLPELADVSATLRPGAPEVMVVYDREQLARTGLDLGTVAERVRALVRGHEATRYTLADRRIPIVVRLAEEDRRTVEDLQVLAVNPGGERPIPLGAVADVRLGEGPSEVRRVNGRRVALVQANLAEASLGEAVASIRRELSALPWPAGMTFVVAGQQQEWQRSAKSLWLALALSVFLVYVIMAAQFESLLRPLVILCTIPLAFFGTALALAATGVHLSVVVFLGMILLAGIVVNNAIVLVDYANLLRGRGLSPVEAVKAAGLVRLRPILMTTGTTVLGLTPMALGVGDGAELRTPMALAVIGGLLASTLLTLVAIPVLYSVFEGWKERLGGAVFEADAVPAGARVATAHPTGAAPAGLPAPGALRSRPEGASS